MREDTRLRNAEVFQVLLLNTRRRLIGEPAKIADGTLDTILVHPREVFRPAIQASAAAIVLVHNHPSGDPAPSEADIKVTRDLIRAGQLLKIEVLDHVILGRATQERPKDYVSLRELGYFYS
jgi:DNA repair protein RadC